MRVLVKIPKGVFLALVVDPAESIYDMKRRIQNAIGMVPEKQCLVFGRVVLENEQMLSQFCIQQNSEFQLIEKLSDNPIISVKSSYGENYDLKYYENENVEGLRKRIHELGIDHKKPFQLFFKGECIDVDKDRKMLANYDITEGSLIEMNPLSGICVVVKAPHGKLITLDVSPSDTVRHVKDLVRAARGVCDDSDNLLFEGTILKNSMKLSDYKIHSGSVLILPHHKELTLEIRFQFTSHLPIVLDAEGSDTIALIKSKIEDKSHIWMENRKLMYGIDELMEGYTLQDYKIICHTTMAPYSIYELEVV